MRWSVTKATDRTRLAVRPDSFSSSTGLVWRADDGRISTRTDDVVLPWAGPSGTGVSVACLGVVSVAYGRPAELFINSK